MTTATARKPRRTKTAPTPSPTQLVEPKAVASFGLNVDAERFARAARVAATFASTDDARMVLTTIHIVSDGQGTVTFDATDSYRLVKLTLRKVHTDGDEPLPKFDVLVPSKWFVRNLPKRPRRIGFGVDLTDESVTVSDRAEFTSATARLVDGRFPNITSLIDGTADHVDGLPEVTALSPGKLSSVLKACETWGGGPWGACPVRIRSLDPLKPILFDLSSGDGDMCALLMPVRLA